MSTIGEQAKRQEAVQFMTNMLTQAGCTPEDAALAAPLLLDGPEQTES